MCSTSLVSIVKAVNRLANPACKLKGVPKLPPEMYALFACRVACENVPPRGSVKTFDKFWEIVQVDQGAKYEYSIEKPRLWSTHLEDESDPQLFYTRVATALDVAVCDAILVPVLRSRPAPFHNAVLVSREPLEKLPSV